MKKKLMFYCQHILGIGHLVRSMEIAKGLLADFEVCFVNGGKIVPDFKVPADVRLVNLPAVETDTEFRELKPVDPELTMADLEERRRNTLLTVLDLYRPDVLVVELFPFGRRRFSFELIPLMERAKELGIKVSCSLRDIVVTKQDRARHEAKICRLMNAYFDQLLIHGDRDFIPLELSFGRTHDLDCDVQYTGYVVQPPEEVAIALDKPTILVSVGGGRFGHELLSGIAAAAPRLAALLPDHHIQMFAGPFSPDGLFAELKAQADICPNLTVDRFTTNFLSYMQQAELSVSMSGYNTTMNVLATGTRAMMLAFEGNEDQEQRLRSTTLDRLGIISRLHKEDLDPEILAVKIADYLQQAPSQHPIDLNGVANTAIYLRRLADRPRVAPARVA